MKIGVLSDTHGHLERSLTAIRQLLDRGAEMLIHCGDIGSEQILIELAGACHPERIPVFAVSGNVDLYDRGILEFPASTGVQVQREHRIPCGEHTLGVLHGDDASRLQQLIEGGTCNPIFTGHTHVARDEMRGGIRVINPGAVYRATQPSVAMYDTGTGDLEILLLDGGTKK